MCVLCVRPNAHSLPQQRTTRFGDDRSIEIRSRDPTHFVPVPVPTRFERPAHKLGSTRGWLRVMGRVSALNSAFVCGRCRTWMPSPRLRNPPRSRRRRHKPRSIFSAPIRAFERASEVECNRLKIGIESSSLNNENQTNAFVLSLFCVFLFFNQPMSP